MKIYSISGMNTEYIDQTENPVCPPGHIEMKGPRPTPDHMAQADGTWIEDGSALERAKSAKLAEINVACDALLNSTVTLPAVGMLSTR